MKDLLIDSGLTSAQAMAYLYLVEQGASAPPALAASLHLTRSNAYKVLDSLQELGLVKREDRNKKIVFVPNDPSALASLIAIKRNQVVALEQNIKLAMEQLRSQYRKSTTSSNVSTGKGVEEIKQAYADQASVQDDIYFVKSRSDIPFMGHDTMDHVRHLVSGTDCSRFGITPAGPEAATAAADENTNLVRTPIPIERYTAPVEWSVSGDELHIITFSGEGSVIRIADTDIADSFRQLWKLMAHKS